MEEKENFVNVTPETFTHPDAPFLPPSVASILVGKHSSHEKWATFLAILVGGLQGDSTFRLFVYYSNDTTSPISVIPMTGISVQTKTLPSGFSFWIFQNDQIEPTWKFATKKDADFQKWIQELSRVIETLPGSPSPIRSADAPTNGTSLLLSSAGGGGNSPLPSPRALAANDELSGSALSRLMPSQKPAAAAPSSALTAALSSTVRPSSPLPQAALVVPAPPPANSSTPTATATGVIVPGAARSGPIPAVSPRPTMNQLVLPSTSPLISPRALSPAPQARASPPPTAAQANSVSPRTQVASPPLSPRPAIAPIAPVSTSNPIAVSPRAPMSAVAPVAVPSASAPLPTGASPRSGIAIPLAASPVKPLAKPAESSTLRPVSPQKPPVAAISPLRARPLPDAPSPVSTLRGDISASSTAGSSPASSSNTSPMSSTAGGSASTPGNYTIPSKPLPVVPKRGGSGLQSGVPVSPSKEGSNTPSGNWGKISPSPKTPALGPSLSVSQQLGSQHRGSGDSPLVSSQSVRQLIAPQLKNSTSSMSPASSPVLSHHHTSNSSLSSTPLNRSNSSNTRSQVSTPQATIRERPKYYHSDYYSNSYLHPDQDTKTRLLHEKDNS